jgi:hypothetical protein
MEVVPSETEERNFVEFRRQGARRGSTLGSHGAAFVVASFHRSGQHRVAEWPRAEIRLRGGLLPVRLQVLGLGSVVEELERIHNQIIQAGRRKRNEPCVRQTGAGLF